MKKFNELKKNDIIKVENYTLKIERYDKNRNHYFVEGKKTNDNATYISMLVTDEDYNKMDKTSRLYCTPFSKVSEVL